MYNIDEDNDHIGFKIGLMPRTVHFGCSTRSKIEMDEAIKKD